MKIVSIVGARPQFIKAAAVSPVLRGLPGVQELLVHTGQHFDPEMSDVVFRELGLPEPDEYLGIGGGTHGQNTGRMLEALEAVLLRERPDRVLVYGDTDTTLAGALAAAKLHIPVAHVEAGLRSFDRRMPEEINRVVADHLSDLLFAPSETAVANLAREGITGDRVKLVGDVMYDLALRDPRRRLGTLPTARPAGVGVAAVRPRHHSSGGECGRPRSPRSARRSSAGSRAKRSGRLPGPPADKGSTPPRGDRDRRAVHHSAPTRGLSRHDDSRGARRRRCHRFRRAAEGGLLLRNPVRHPA